MKTYQPFKQACLLAILIFTFFTISVKAQTPTNLSGNWQYEKAKSIIDKLDPDFDGTIILEIKQSATAISFCEIYKRQGAADFKTSADLYTLDGKEKITKSDIGTSKKTAKWSADKKTLTITNIDTQTLKGVLQDFIVTDTYSLSSDGKTLTIERYRKNPVTGETKAKKIYTKK